MRSFVSSELFGNNGPTCTSVGQLNLAAPPLSEPIHRLEHKTPGSHPRWRPASSCLLPCDGTQPGPHAVAGGSISSGCPGVCTARDRARAARRRTGRSGQGGGDALGIRARATPNEARSTATGGHPTAVPSACLLSPGLGAAGAGEPLARPRRPEMTRRLSGGGGMPGAMRPGGQSWAVPNGVGTAAALTLAEPVCYCAYVQMHRA